MRKILAIAACLLLVFAVYLSYTTVDSEAPEAVAKGKTYSGTLYVAGMGGHFAKAEVVIDPSNKKNPIKVENLGMTRIGNKKTHPTHDARIDVVDGSKMYWSTYKPDKEIGAEKRMVHVGVSDLNTGKVIKDVALKLDDRAKFIAPIYCGSGQTKKSFLPVTMTGEAYIDVFDKGTLKHTQRVFLDELGYKENYLFMHGVNNPDMTGFAVPINITEKWPSPAKPGKTVGKVDMVLLDLAALEKGKVKVLAKNTVTGDPKKTKTFRGTYTPDGKLLLQSGADRMYVLDGKTMKLVNEVLPLPGENHDAMATPDSRYAVLTLRALVKGTKVKDGTLQLYDIKKKKLLGNPVSVCKACHDNMGITGSAVLCGLDGAWN
jgi:hypothetical protein